MKNKFARVRVICRRNRWWRKRHPRPAQIIGLGTAKSGTYSIANLFAKHYQALHETPKFPLLGHVLDYLEGRTPRPEFIDILRDHDRRWQPTVNVANFFGDVAGEIVEAFPDARFIITIRDCYTWLCSRMSQSLVLHSRVGRAPKLRLFCQLQDRRFGGRDEADYPPEESAIRDAGLPPIEAVLRHWAQFNERILAAVPEDRRLVIRTRDIRASIPQIADLAGVPVESLDAGSAHSHKSAGKPFELWELVDHAHIERLADRHCSELMCTYYPEITSVEAALSAR